MSGRGEVQHKSPPQNVRFIIGCQLAASPAMVNAARGHVDGDEFEGDLFEEFFVVIPIVEGDFGDVGEDAAVDEVAADAGM